MRLLKNPEEIKKFGLSVPKGILFSGPPGTGKTFLAHAMASEAELPFFNAVASEFDEELVGVGAKRIRELFAKATKAASLSVFGYAVVFIDEFDLFSDRSTRAGQSYKQTTNQLLTSLESNPKVIVVAATNHKDSIDSALIRSGRFDRIVEFQMPEREGRLAILKQYSSKLLLSEDVDLNKVADKTAGLSPASLKNIVNQAALLAFARKHENVSQDLFEEVSDIELRKVQ
ncbi:MAG: AAA family ATPase [Chlamydiales bacterium]|nr:AAA family ATPase [Chlamydiales bacterium]